MDSWKSGAGGKILELSLFKGYQRQRPLHLHFHQSDVQRLDPARFRLVHRIAEAPSNSGDVWLMTDRQEDRRVAVKKIPNAYLGADHAEFVRMHPSALEMPWQDVGCVRLLGDRGFPFVCKLRGIFRGPSETLFVSDVADGGDLFDWCNSGLPPPGLDREAAVLPVFRQILRAVQSLHGDFGIAHRDLSMENVLLTKEAPEGKLAVRVIDFCMAHRRRLCPRVPCGKPSYRAPELHGDGEFVDGFALDVFALGVVLFCLLLKQYPWYSTNPKSCKYFDYAMKPA